VLRVECRVLSVECRVFRANGRFVHLDVRNVLELIDEHMALHVRDISSENGQSLNAGAKWTNVLQVFSQHEAQRLTQWTLGKAR